MKYLLALLGPISLGFGFVLVDPAMAFPAAVCGYACGVAGAGPDPCPAKNSQNNYSYYCSGAGQQNACGGPVQNQNSSCDTFGGNKCGTQVSKLSDMTIPDPDDPTLGKACNQTYSFCRNAPDCLTNPSD